jgi:ABC-2 type transport system ATP-binding protein
VQVCGIDLLDRPVAAKAHVGYLPEQPPLYRDFSVDDYLLLAAKLHRVPPARRRDAIARTKARCGLATEGARVIGTLSKGYQQRVGIAQAILHDPDVVVLDEPTVGLDPNQIREIRTLIRALAAERSVILSTHILPEVEAVCDRVQILSDGRVVWADTIDALRSTRAGDAWSVVVHEGVRADDLGAIAGVIEVHAVAIGRWRVRLADPTGAVDALVDAAARGGWRLRELAPATTSLEDLFVELTRGASEADAGAASSDSAASDGHAHAAPHAAEEATAP